MASQGETKIPAGAAGGPGEGKSSSATEDAAALEAEEKRRVNAEAKNALESFIIDTRDKLGSEEGIEQVSTEEVREVLRADFEKMEDWLYEEGLDLSSKEYNSKKKELEAQVAPIFLEVALVCVYLWIFYTWYFGIITFLVIVAYIAFTVPFTEWRNKFRRQQTDADDVFNQKATDSLLNFETVKLFCAEPHIAHVTGPCAHS